MKINVIDLGKEITVKLIVPGSSGLLGFHSKKCRIDAVSAKEVLYKNGSIINSFVIISDPNTGRNYVFPSSDTNCFYISYNSGMVVFSLGYGADFMWFERYFEVSKSANVNTVVARFVSEFGDDQKISQFYRKVPRVNLMSAANRFFFSANSNSTAPAIPIIKSIDLTGEVLCLNLLSDGGKFAGSFWIDLKDKKVVKSVVMDVQSGKQVYPTSIFDKLDL
jgi:hypothetical protein